MALIQCYNCGKPVSDKANACPHCGAPVTSVINDANNSIPDNLEATNAEPDVPESITPPQQNEYNFDDSSNGGSKKAIWIILAVIAVLGLGAGGWYWHDSETKRLERERELRQDSIDEVREQERMAELALQQAEQARLDSIRQYEDQIKNEVRSMWEYRYTYYLTPEFQRLIQKDEEMYYDDYYSCIDGDIWTGEKDCYGSDISSIELSDVHEKSATATVNYSCSGNSYYSKLMLVRIDDEWRVNEIIHEDGCHVKQQLTRCIKEKNDRRRREAAEMASEVVDDAAYDAAYDFAK